MKKLFVALLLLSALRVAGEDQLTLTIYNDTDAQRQDMVEVNLQTVLDRLGIKAGDAFVVKNDIGQEITYQQSYDGKLLLHVAVHAKDSVIYTIARGEHAPFKVFVQGKMHPERADDMTWENDRGIYRVYGPALQRTGERSFGTDIWVKNTPELQADYRYRLHLEGEAKRRALKKEGQDQAAHEMSINTSFHLDHGLGLDCYAVGPSLGCGAPALMVDDKLQLPYCYKDYKILDNGPLRFTVELTYNTTADGITEHRIISLDKGTHFNRMTVWYDGITEPKALAAGVVLHGENQLVLGKNYVQYADPTDNPKLHQSQLYVATLFPESVDETMVVKGELNHAVGVVRHYDGKPYTYYFGSAWSNYDVFSQKHWQLCIDDFFARLSAPLRVKL